MTLRKHLEPGQMLTSDGGEVTFAPPSAPAPASDFGDKIATLREATEISIAAVKLVKDYQRDQRIKKLCDDPGYWY